MQSVWMRSVCCLACYAQQNIHEFTEKHSTATVPKTATTTTTTPITTISANYTMIKTMIVLSKAMQYK